MDEFEKEYADLAAAYRRASTSASSAEGRRRAQADYDQAVREVAQRQQSQAKPQPAQAKPQPAATPSRPPSFGESARGYTRAAAQGLTFGFGDEAEALARSLVGPESYGQEVGKIRGQMREFREARPASALTAEIAGGAVTGVGGLARAGTRLAGRAMVPQIARGAAGQGALSGAGAAEGDIGNRLAGAATGAAVGGTVGSAIGKAAGAAGRIASRVSQGGKAFPGASVGAMARLAEQADIPDVAGAVRQAATQASPETRVMDVLGRPGARTATALRLAGGRPSETISTTLEQRVASRPDRLSRGLYGPRTAENVVETVDDLIAQRRATATPLYDAALGARTAAGTRNAPEIVDDVVEEYLKRPLFRRAVKQAEDDILNAGGRVQYRSLPDGTEVPVRTPEFLDNVKKAMDDIIYRGRQPGEGGFGPGQLARAKQVRGEFVAMLDDLIPGYADARAAWAGPTALKGALEDGVDAASSRIDPNALAKQVGELSSGEREFFQRGFLDRLRQRVEDGQLNAAEVRTAGFEKRMRSVFGDEADRIVAAVREEMTLSERATRILGGSPTAERLQALADIDIPMVSGKTIRATGEPTRTAARGADWLEARMRTGLTERRRGSVAEALMTPVGRAEPLLAKLAREQQAQQVGRRIERFSPFALSRILGARTGENFRE
jgi:hypothetical protein